MKNVKKDCSPPKRPTAPQAEEDPEVIPETPNEEVGEERVLVAPPRKTAGPSASCVKVGGLFCAA